MSTRDSPPAWERRPGEKAEAAVEVPGRVDGPTVTLLGANEVIIDLSRYVPRGERLRTYRTHYCHRQHRHHYTLARCMWPWAEWVSGNGPIALVSRCHAFTVSLWQEGPDGAPVDKCYHRMRWIDRLGCGSNCRGAHVLRRLVLPAEAEARSDLRRPRRRGRRPA